jgi:hypothetical protein
VVTGQALSPLGRGLQLRRSRPHCHGRSPRCAWRHRWPTGRSHRVAPSLLFHPHWPPSTGTRQVSTWGRQRMMWRGPPVTSPNRCAAVARRPSTEQPWPTGERPAESRPWPWQRRGALGSRGVRSERAGALRGGGAIRHRCRRARDGPRALGTTVNGANGSIRSACWPARSAPQTRWACGAALCGSGPWS